MKRALTALLFFLISSSFAQSVGLELKEVTIQAFAQSVFRGVMQRDYVISPSLLSSEKRLSVSIKEVSRDRAMDTVKAVLAAVDVQVVDREGVLFIEPASSTPIADARPNASRPSGASGLAESNDLPSAEVAVYRPRYRSASFLSSVVRLAGCRVVEDNAKDASKSSDVFVFAGSAEAIEKAQRLLIDVDQAIGAVSIRAAVLEVTEANESARSLSSVLTLLTGRLGIHVEAGSEQKNAISIKSSSLSAVLSAIDGDSRFRYVAEPSIRVIDGESASLVVGSDVPVRGQSTIDKAGNPIQSVDYRTAGVVLEVSPRILRDVVLLKVRQQISSFATTTTSGIDSPTVLKRQSETVVDAGFGDVVILAGLDESRTAQTSSGLSWLPSWFKSRSDASTRSQIVLLLEVRKGSEKGSDYKSSGRPAAAKPAGRPEDT